jgi:methylthioxylose transferase
VTIAAAIALGLGVRATGHRLGTALPPFVMGWLPAVSWWAAPAIGVAALAVAAAPTTLRLRPPAFAAALCASGLAVALTVNASRAGPVEWTWSFRGSFEALNEYLPGLPALAYGTRFFLDRFAELVPALPPNVSAHPPGLIVTVHLLGLTTPGRLAALCIGAAATIAPLTYALARRLLPERRARIAGLLAAASPCVVLFGTTSADAVYAALGTAAAALLAAPSWRARGAGAALLGVAALFSWLLLAVGAWAALLAWLREGPGPAVVTAASCAVAVVAVQALFAGVYGYDPLGTLAATHAVYLASPARIRPYAFWVVGSPAAWATLVGPPIVLAAVSARGPATRATAAIVAVAAVSGLTKAETERIWLPFVPLICVAAAEAGVPRLRLALALLLAQALVVELLFYTVW